MKRFFYIFYNRLFFRAKGVVLGKNFRVYNKVFLKKTPNSRMIIGDNFTFTSGNGLNPITTNTVGEFRLDGQANIIIGDNCGMSSTVLWANKSITIGNNVLIGGGCLIMDSDRHSLNYHIRNGSIRDENGKKIDTQSAKTAPIIIEDDVLIGARVIILKGVKIGARSIVGAGSVVTKDIPSDVIAGGNPCKVIQSIEQDR